ncbi:hypothetical protein [Altericroceibacterium spongiae]|uniref:hypothetical protein n=1 Tax=Altericroceibacterium spongiae TaxID=2320269 RepID=UPI001EE5A3CF|nr:hypothetical protein [Altericroceibacterium spongiae]
MTIEKSNQHYELKDVGLRAQATAAGLVQLCKELHGAGVLDEAALDRIKASIADEIALTCPRSIRRDKFRNDVCDRLDSLFSGELKVGTHAGLEYETAGAD